MIYPVLLVDVAETSLPCDVEIHPPGFAAAPLARPTVLVAVADLRP